MYAIAIWLLFWHWPLGSVQQRSYSVFQCLVQRKKLRHHMPQLDIASERKVRKNGGEHKVIGSGGIQTGCRAWKMTNKQITNSQHWRPVAGWGLTLFFFFLFFLRFFWSGWSCCAWRIAGTESVGVTVSYSLEYTRGQVRTIPANYYSMNFGWVLDTRCPL